MNILVLALPILVVIAICAVIYLKHRMNNAKDRGNLEAEIDSEIRKITHKHSSYGVVVGVYKNGESFIKSYGTVSKDSTDPPNAETIFQLGSLSKLFTAATLQILCDEGVLRMDATLGEVMGDRFTLSLAAQHVTLRQLVTHTSGFPRVPKPLVRKVCTMAGKKNLLKNPYSHLAVSDVFDYLQSTEGKRAVGRFQYSNFGMGLLGHVMEIVTENDLASLVAEKLLTQLGMQNTAITLTPAMIRNLAQGYAANGEINPLWTFGALAGAGAFNSTASDMMKFIQANIDGSSVINRTLKQMHLKQFAGHTGIGWLQPTFLDRFLGNRFIVWHNGMVGGYASYLSLDTANKTGLVVLSNRSVDVTMLGMMLTRRVRTQSWSPQ